MKNVIVSAAPYEVAPLTESLRRQGLDHETASVGIGALNAARAAFGLRATCAGANTLFVGTCGTFGEFSGVMLVRAERVIWRPTGDLHGLSYTIAGTAPEIRLPEPPPPFLALPAATVVCGPGVSLALPANLAEQLTGAVENLELYSVAGDLVESAATLAVVLAVTNQIGPNAHAEYKRHAKEAAERSRDFIMTRLFGGARGE